MNPEQREIVREQTRDRVAKWRRDRQQKGLVRVEVYVEADKVERILAFAKGDANSLPNVPPKANTEEPKPAEKLMLKMEDIVISILQVDSKRAWWVEPKMDAYHQTKNGTWMAILPLFKHIRNASAVGGAGGKAWIRRIPE